MKRANLQWIQGELLGTFLLVFFGLGAVATSVAMDAPVGLFQVAITWGLGLAVAILLCGKLSGAHFNPAITLAFAVFTDFPAKRVPGYILAQFAGAFLAAAAVYALFGGAIGLFEVENGISRGEPGSEASAKIFGEFYGNLSSQPGADASTDAATHLRACLAEFMGTTLLALVIFGFIAKQNSAIHESLLPFAIGMALTVLICIFAPLSMGGFNPARDFAPRLFSSMAGWGKVPFETNGIGWLTVYILSPCAGALLGGFIGTKLAYGEKEHSNA